MARPLALKRLHSELLELSRYPPALCSAGPMADDMFKWRGLIIGPKGTPYEGGIFGLKIIFPENYPFSPPRVQFITRIYHSKIDRNGTICLDLLKRDWSPLKTVSTVLLAIRCLLEDPVPQDILVPEIAKVYFKDRAQYNLMARAWTKKYAK